MRLALPIGVILISIVTAFISLSCSPTPSQALDTLTIAAVQTELNALVYVAQDREIFRNNGLRIILKDYDSGAAAAAGMLNAEAEVAFAAEFPIVRQVFNNEEIVTLGTIARYENTYIIWRTNSGIKTVQNLKGKKIGLTLTTISEFYLGRTLDLNGVGIKQVTMVDTRAADVEQSLASGEVDAVVTWEPWVNQIRQHMGDQVTIEPAQSDQYAFWNLVTTFGWNDTHSAVLERLMKSLAQAEDYISGHEDEAKAIIRKRMNFDELYLAAIWPRYEFSLSLDQSLITAMEDEARWMINNSLVSEKTVPNFLDHISENALKEIKPGGVDIIR